MECMTFGSLMAAYSSNWADGDIVDEGATKMNETDRSKSRYNPFLAMAGQGSPGNPVKLGEMKIPMGITAAFLL